MSHVLGYLHTHQHSHGAPKVAAGDCPQCNRPIVDAEFAQYTSTTSPVPVNLHLHCEPQYLMSKNGPCHQCRKALVGEICEVSSAPGLCFHQDCVLDYKKSVRPKCKKCGDAILEDSYYHSHNERRGEDDVYHKGCWDDQKKINVGNCTQCHQNIEDNEYLGSESAGVQLHYHCKEDYLKACYGVCSHCDRVLVGELVEQASLPNMCFHKDCLVEYKKGTRPHCPVCNRVILDDAYYTQRNANGQDDTIHNGCWDGYLAKTPIRVGDCADCGKIITNHDKYVIPEQSSSHQERWYHKKCWEDHNHRLESQKPTERCMQCGDDLGDEHVVYAMSQSEKMQVKIHERCMAEYRKNNNGVCGHCEKPLVGKLDEISSAPGLVFHHECVIPYKHSVRPKCTACSDIVMDDRYLSDIKGDCHYHTNCFNHIL